MPLLLSSYRFCQAIVLGVAACCIAIWAGTHKKSTVREDGTVYDAINSVVRTGMKASITGLVCHKALLCCSLAHCVTTVLKVVT